MGTRKSIFHPSPLWPKNLFYFSLQARISRKHLFQSIFIKIITLAFWWNHEIENLLGKPLIQLVLFLFFLKLIKLIVRTLDSIDLDKIN